MGKHRWIQLAIGHHHSNRRQRFKKLLLALMQCPLSRKLFLSQLVKMHGQHECPHMERKFNILQSGCDLSQLETFSDKLLIKKKYVIFVAKFISNSNKCHERFRLCMRVCGFALSYFLFFPIQFISGLKENICTYTKT